MADISRQKKIQKAEGISRVKCKRQKAEDIRQKAVRHKTEVRYQKENALYFALCRLTSDFCLLFLYSAFLDSNEVQLVCNLSSFHKADIRRQEENKKKTEGRSQNAEG